MHRPLHSHYSAATATASATASLAELSGLPRLDPRLSADMARLREEAETARRERDEVADALQAYKLAFEQQLSKAKAEHEQLMLYQSAASTSSHQLQKQYVDVRQLANVLMETLNDKDLALSHMRSANRILGSRLRDLESKESASAQQQQPQQSRPASRQYSPSPVPLQSSTTATATSSTSKSTSPEGEAVVGQGGAT